MIEGTCPVCGGVLDKALPLCFMRDQDLFSEEDAGLVGCICSYGLTELEQMVTTYENRLLELLRERFPGRNKEEVILLLQKMDRNSPLRSVALRKLSTLGKAKDRLKALYEQMKVFKKDSDRQDEIKNKGVTGDVLGLSDWLRSFTQGAVKKSSTRTRD